MSLTVFKELGIIMKTLRIKVRLIVICVCVFGILTFYLWYMNTYRNIDIVRCRVSEKLEIPVEDITWLGGGKVRFPTVVLECSTNHFPWLKMTRCEPDDLPWWQPQIRYMQGVLKFYQIPLKMEGNYSLYFIGDDPSVRLVRIGERVVVFYD